MNMITNYCITSSTVGLIIIWDDERKSTEIPYSGTFDEFNELISKFYHPQFPSQNMNARVDSIHQFTFSSVFVSQFVNIFPLPLKYYMMGEYPITEYIHCRMLNTLPMVTMVASVHSTVNQPVSEALLHDDSIELPLH